MLLRRITLIASIALVSACSREAPPAASPAAPAQAEGRPATPAPTPPPVETAAASVEEPALVAPEEFGALSAPRKDDLPGMVKAREVRLLVNYNSTSYYVDRGRQGGLNYDAGRLLEEELNRRFNPGPRRINVIFIPVTRDRLLPALLEGHGDIAAANLTITPARLAQVDFCEPLLSGVNEVVVSGPGAPPVKQVEDLAGREVYVRASSSYAESLAALNHGLAKRGLAPVRVVAVDERLETEDILEMVNAGLYPLTVADDYIARLWSRVFADLRVHGDVTVRTGGRIGWAVRKGNPKLKALLDDFARRNRVGTKMGNIVANRYLGNADWIHNPGNERDLARFRSMLALFRKYGGRYGFDPLLLMAQAYQESGLDQSRRSRAGAIGVMQVLPSTARDANVGVRDIHLLENNVHAGAKYLRFVVDHHFRNPPLEPIERQLFAFASYNAGPTRVAGLRARAARMGLDPNRWFGQVEIVAAREIGRETVQYVANIFKYYLAYRLVTEHARARSQARQAPAATP